MTYTWGYLKENTLSKLNVEEEEANQLGFLSRFPYAANEAMTQICSGIKPKLSFFVFKALDMVVEWKRLTEKYQVYLDTTEVDDELSEDDDEFERKSAFWAEWKTLHFTDSAITMPEDFVAFYDDVTEFNGEEVGDDILLYQGSNQIICKEVGTYKIPYSARWFFFTKETDNNEVIPAPADVLDAIPSYITSQCLKIDDEKKSGIYRNEYEMFLARIDDTSFKRQRTFTIGGNW